MSLSIAPVTQKAASDSQKDTIHSLSLYKSERRKRNQSKSIKMESPKKLLFVCSGNTCRSPMAMIVAEKTEAEKGNHIIAKSAAGSIDGGEFKAESILSKKAIDALEEAYNEKTRIVDHDPQPLSYKLIDEADYVIFLGAKFRKNAEERFREALKGKAMFYCSYQNKKEPSDKERHEVPDPLDGDNWEEYYKEKRPGWEKPESYRKVLYSMMHEFYPELRKKIFPNQ